MGFCQLRGARHRMSDPRASEKHARAHRRVPDGTAPPYPSFVARHEHRGAGGDGLFRRPDPAELRQRRAAGIDLDRRRLAGMAARHMGPARCIDEAGFTNVVTVAYWTITTPNSTAGSRRRAKAGPANSERPKEFGSVHRGVLASLRGGLLETLFSSLGRPEGVAVLADGMSGEVSGTRLLGHCAIAFPIPAGASGAIRRSLLPSATAPASGSCHPTMSA